MDDDRASCDGLLRSVVVDDVFTGSVLPPDLDAERIRTVVPGP
jgi:hypothetical protein